MSGRRYYKKVLIYFIGNFSAKILSAVIIPIYALYVSASDLGVFDYLQTIMNIAVVLAFFAIWESILRFLLDESERVKKEYTNTIILFTSVISIIVFLCALLISLKCGLSIKISVCNALMDASYGIAQVWQYLSRGYEKNTVYVESGIIGTAINFIMILLLVCWHDLGIIGLLLSYAIGRISVVFTIEFKLHFIKRFTVSDFSNTKLAEMIKFSFPLSLNSIAGWALGGLGSVIIINKFGEEKNGLYAFSMKFAALVISLGSIFVMALIEEAIIEYKSTKNSHSLSIMINNVENIFSALIIILLPLVGVFYLIIPSASEYGVSINYIPFVLLYSFFSVSSSVIGSMFQVIDKTKYQFTTTLLGAVLMLGISFILLNTLDVYAVLIAQMIGAMIMLLDRIYIVNKYVKLKNGGLSLIVFFIIYIMLSLVIVFVKSISLLIMITIIVISVVAIKYTKEIKQMLRLMKRKKITQVK